LLRWFYVALHLLSGADAARRDACIRFLKAQGEILRRKFDGDRVIPSPDDRGRLLAIGQELDQNVAGVIGIVTPQTHCRGVGGTCV
jgi:putative transposase